MIVVSVVHIQVTLPVLSSSAHIWGATWRFQQIKHILLSFTGLKWSQSSAKTHHNTSTKAQPFVTEKERLINKIGWGGEMYKQSGFANNNSLLCKPCLRYTGEATFFQLGLWIQLTLLNMNSPSTSTNCFQLGSRVLALQINYYFCVD